MRKVKRPTDANFHKEREREREKIKQIKFLREPRKTVQQTTAFKTKLLSIEEKSTDVQLNHSYLKQEKQNVLINCSIKR